jgi:hypothetical protein
MQRIRMSLPYYRQFGWDPTVVTVNPKYSDIVKDDLLFQSTPDGLEIIQVGALNKKYTSKLGLGSIALRSLNYYRRKVNAILKHTQYDLIFFSTTQFPICILGAYWKKHFSIPYVIDMQDPWVSDYYVSKPQNRRPKKFWFSFYLNKFLEPIAIKNANGLISVSDDYIFDLKKRYPEILRTNAVTITFGAFKLDFEIARKNEKSFADILSENTTNIVYIGRGGIDMHASIIPLFDYISKNSLLQLSKTKPIKFYFIGTSYAKNGTGDFSILPLAKKYGLEKMVIEITHRISYYHTLLTLVKADALYIPGSDDPKYSASKIYTYLLANKLILAIFNSKSPVIKILKTYGLKHIYNYENISKTDFDCFFKDLFELEGKDIEYNADALKAYSAEQMTLRQCSFFDKIVTDQ